MMQCGPGFARIGLIINDLRVEMAWRRRSRMKWLDALLTAVHGTRVRVLRRIERFDHRNYPMVVFLPQHDVPLLRQTAVSSQ